MAKAKTNIDRKNYDPSQVDQYHGEGGSYRIDQETGERVLIEQSRTRVPGPREAPSEKLADQA